MIWVPGAEFTMGSNRHYPEEAPAHRASVAGFWIDEHPVTNDEFATFVAATGHVTAAESFAGSAVFTPPGHRVDLSDPYRWWSLIPGADWRHPLGPNSSIAELGCHPVVHVAWDDVVAYAAWAGKHLPTEAEWELAARGGLEDAEFAWGDELTPGGAHMANVWQGDFPNVNDLGDGYRWTSPVKSFPPNGFRLYDMIGNVWEWTVDWWSKRHVAQGIQGCCSPESAQRQMSVDPEAPIEQRLPRKVMKGGSYLCAPNYCRRYRPAARLPQTVDTSTCHLGFRCVRRPAPLG